jgi:hypothetical protein
VVCGGLDEAALPGGGAHTQAPAPPTAPQVASARLLDLDRLGMNLEVSRAAGEAPFKLRLPFTRAAEERKGIKDAIVEMTRAAKGAGQGQ